MTIIGPVESERKMYSGSSDPGELYRRMMPTSDDKQETGDEIEITDADLLFCLRSLNPDDLESALTNFSDSEVEYLSSLLEAADD
jgi:hypothetical protein